MRKIKTDSSTDINRKKGLIHKIIRSSGLSALMVMIFLFSGCFPTQKRDTAEASINSDVTAAETDSGSEASSENKSEITGLKDIPSVVQESTKSAYVDAHVEIGNDSAQLTTLSAQGTLFSYDTVKNILSGDEIFTQNTEVPDQLTQVYQGSDGGSLVLGPGEINYTSGKNMLKQYSLVLNSSIIKDDRYINNGVFTKEEIPGLDRPQIISQAKQWLSELGIENTGEPAVVALDYDTLSTEYENLKGGFPKESEPFTPDDEGYYLVFRCEYDGIPFLAQDYVLAGKTLCFGSVIQMIVTEDGLRELTARGIYDIQDNGAAFDSIYGFDQVVKKAETKFQDVILEEPVQITRIELIYAPDVVSVNPITYELSPCWVFYAASSSQVNGTDMFFYYSAVTGEELGIE